MDSDNNLLLKKIKYIDEYELLNRYNNLDYKIAYMDNVLSNSKTRGDFLLHFSNKNINEFDIVYNSIRKFLRFA